MIIFHWIKSRDEGLIELNLDFFFFLNESIGISGNDGRKRANSSPLQKANRKPDKIVKNIHLEILKIDQRQFKNWSCTTVTT